MGSEPGGEFRDAALQLVVGGVEGVVGAESHRVGDRPVQMPVHAEFFVRVVAHGDYEIRTGQHRLQRPRRLVGEVECVAVRGRDRARVDAVCGVRGHLVGEVVATAGLVLLIFALAHTGKGSVTAAAVGAYIGAAYWFTSSTSFANPAVTIARMFTDTFAGIAPASVAPFILAQLVGAALGLALLLVFYPTAARTPGDVVVPTQPETTS